MPSTRFQPSFAAGVLGPGLHGRVDIAKYDVGLKVGKNVFVHAHGGVSNRPGTEFICEVMDSTKYHRLIPFERDDDENHILLMGDATMKVIDGGAVVQSGGSDYSATTPFATAHLEDLDYVQSIDVMYFAHQSYFPRKMSRTALTSWSFANLGLDPTGGTPTGVTATEDDTTATASQQEQYTYVVTAVVDGAEGFPSAEASTATNGKLLELEGMKNTIAWSAVTGADHYRVYRERSGVFGYVGYTSDLAFEDDNIAADLTTTPPVAATVFGSSADYPGVVTMHQQRLIFANSQNQPETVWASRIGDYENFTKGETLLDDQRIETDITGRRLNRVRSMVQLRELVVFTAAGEFSLTGPNGAFPAANLRQTQYGYSGASKVSPMVVEDTLLFVDSTGRQVRDLRYTFEQDGYTGNDLTIFASHYFEGKTIRAWAFQKNPFSLIWACLDDGTLLSLTYKREHQVWAWCEHDIGGQVESIAAIREGDEDAVYMIVKRTVNGSDVRYVERLHSRHMASVDDAFFVDCGLTYSGAATTSITGLDHLEGETVVALADGNVIEGLTVSSGTVTLPNAASTVHVGLSYTAEIETLPPPIEMQGVGNARGRPIKASRVYMQLERTRGIQGGPTGRMMTPLVQVTSDLADDIDLFTGMVQLQLSPEWNRDGTIVVQQTYPLPMTILGISPDYSVGV